MAATTIAPTKSTAVVEIERLGFGWSEDANYDLGQLVNQRDPETGRVQVREVAHYTPKQTVEEYAVAMGETPFPPIVVTADHFIVDGNTRVAARMKRKEKFTPAIVLNVAFAGANEKTQGSLVALAATLNQTGGQRLTPKEVRQAAEHLVRLGWKTEQIGRAIGAKGSTVTQVKREIAAAAKFQRVGLEPNGMKPAALRALGAEKVVGLNDVPFRELAQLTTDAGLNVVEINSLAREARELGSDTAAVDRLRQVRTELGDRITEFKLTGKFPPPDPRQLRQHLGFVTKYEGRVQELIETDPAVNAVHLEAIDKAMAVLTELRQLQAGS
jgi:hypothetical protein